MASFRSSTSSEEMEIFMNGFEDEEVQCEITTIQNAEIQDKEIKSTNVNDTSDTHAYIKTENTAEEFIKDLNDEIQKLTKENNELRQTLKTAGTSYSLKLALAEKHEKTINRMKEEASKKAEEYKHVQEKLIKAGESYTEKALLAENHAKTIQRLQDNVNKKTEECKTVQEKHENEIQTLQGKNENQKRMIESLQHNETIYTQNIRQLSGETKNKEAEKQQLLIRFERELQTLQRIEDNQMREIERLQQNETIYAHNIRQLSEEKKNIEAEKQQLLLRLSKLTGAKLTIDNPNIADLSDDKRPTKLAEEFAEMYDNEWTDAFEEVNIEDEREKIAFMLDILKRAYELCKGVSEDHMDRIKLNICKLSVCGKDLSGKSAERLQHERSYDTPELKPKTDGEAAIDVVVGKDHVMHDLTFEFGSLPDDLKKGVMDSRKLVEKSLSKQLEKIATIVIASEKGIDVSAHTYLSKYIVKCINICWSMCCIVPPVVVGFQEVVSDMHFDTCVYKQYTKTGKKIDYIVWPALFLHQDGPMLCKGVAQGRS